MGDYCTLCLKSLSNADANNSASGNSSEILLELSDIVVIPQKAALVSSSGKLCKVCQHDVNERIALKSKIRKADERIKKRYYGAIFEKMCSQLYNADTVERRMRNSVGNDGMSGSLSSINRQTSDFTERANFGDNASSKRAFGGINDVNKPFVKAEKDSNLCKIEKELWGDDIDDLQRDSSSNKDNM